LRSKSSGGSCAGQVVQGQIAEELVPVDDDDGVHLLGQGIERHRRDLEFLADDLVGEQRFAAQRLDADSWQYSITSTARLLR